MVDSDDEYDRKRRDKFRGERSTGGGGDSYRSDRRDDRRGGGGGGREDWGERNSSRGRGGRPDYYRGGGGRDRYSPGRDLPPPKRMRPDWGDDRPRYPAHDAYGMYAWGHEHYPMHGMHGFGGGGGGVGGHPPPMSAAAMHNNRADAQNSSDSLTQPPMLTLKQFLDTQDDGISDSEVLRKYSEYKLEFKRQQLNEFFVAHKDEEWFKNKYHPEEALKRKEEQLSFLKKRVDVFLELLNKGMITSVSVDVNQSDQLLRLLDTVVIKLEGGTEEDLKILDEKPVEQQTSTMLLKPFESLKRTIKEQDDDVIITDIKPKIKQEVEKDFNWEPIPSKLKQNMKKAQSEDEENWDDQGSPPPISSSNKKIGANSDDDDDDDDWEKSEKKQRKQDKDDFGWNDSTELKKNKRNKSSKNTANDDENNWDDDEDDEDEDKTTKNDEGDGNAMESSPKKKTKSEWDDDDDDVTSPKKIASSPTIPAPRKRRTSSESSSSSEDEEKRLREIEKQTLEKKRNSVDETEIRRNKSTSPQKIQSEEIDEQRLQQEKDKNEHAKGDDDAEMTNKQDTPANNEDVIAETTRSSDMNKKEEQSTTADDNKEIQKKKETEDKMETETIDLIETEKDSASAADAVTTNAVTAAKPRALHRTSSIFLRNLAPAITKAEIEAICRRYDGFLRVAIADPLVERRWFRRGWVTFQRDVNIKEICWNLNNIRLRDCEMGAIVNRDLSRRVRPVNGITAHKAIVRNDIKLLAKIALNLDEKFSLWMDKKLTEYNEQQQDSSSNTKNGDVLNSSGNKDNIKTSSVTSVSFGFKSNNPVLQNITDYLIEEASAEEDELLGLSTSGDNATATNDGSGGETLERDPQLITVLDKLILYMRVVHSVDFYNHCEYPYEDEMPNRCGIIHARGPPPPNNKITKQDIDDYIKNFETKMSSFLVKTNTTIEEEELKNLGCKDAEAEVEKFVQANTQELSKDKWLCPLSGKKFKGPEFIRKHIFNKHMEKIDEVRKEVEYFNNYLKDPKRPQLPEHPGNTKRSQPSSDMVPQMPYRPGYPAPGYAPPYAAYAPPIIAPPRPRAFGNRRELPPDHQRRIVGYHDLDAPQNFDFFE